MRVSEADSEHDIKGKIGRVQIVLEIVEEVFLTNLDTEYPTVSIG
jgi:hypothetical protein